MNKFNSAWYNKIPYSKKWNPNNFTPEETFTLTVEQLDGIKSLIKWLETNSGNDLTNTVSNTIKQLQYVIIREYYTESEKQMLNMLRAQYLDKNNK